MVKDGGLSFETQLKIEFLSPNNGSKKCLEKPQYTGLFCAIFWLGRMHVLKNIFLNGKFHQARSHLYIFHLKVYFGNQIEGSR